MPEEDHTRPRLLERQKDVEKSLRKLGWFKSHDPAIVEAVLDELKLDGAAIDRKERIIYFGWIKGSLKITDDGVECQ